LVTAARYQVGTVVCVQDKDMKQAWCLAASSPDATARTLMNLYGKRWGIECGLRDAKDLRVNAASNFPKCAEVKFPSWRVAVISRLGGDRGLHFWAADRGGAAAVPGLAC
jgi:hypothetical protein